jgi:hypothetical protein
MKRFWETPNSNEERAEAYSKKTSLKHFREGTH